MVLLGLLPLPASADVHPDCLDQQWGVTCDKARVADARTIDQVVAPLATRLGWKQGCYRVQYVKGDDGAPGTILVRLHGAKGGAAPACITTAFPSLTPGEKQALVDRGLRGDALAQAAIQVSTEKAQRAAASETTLRKLAAELLAAIAALPAEDRGRLLRGVADIVVVNGWGGTGSASVP
jgi:hypothetical protein